MNGSLDSSELRNEDAILENNVFACSDHVECVDALRRQAMAKGKASPAAALSFLIKSLIAEK
jgi:hypothetical protein